MMMITNLLNALAVAAGCATTFGATVADTPAARMGYPEAIRCGVEPVAIGTCMQRLQACRVSVVTVDGRSVALADLNLHQLPPRERGRMERAIRAAYYDLMG